MPDIVSRLSAKRAERQGAEALEAALARFERLLKQGLPAQEATTRAASGVQGEARELFGLASALRSSRAAMPDPGFGEALELRLRDPRAGAEVVPLRRPSRVAAIAAVAAVALLAVGIGRASVSSLPGESLYGVKRRGEAVRLAITSGRSEAMLRIELADNRLDEVNGLVARERSRVVGFPGLDLAAAPSGVRNPRIAKLIETALRDAAHQMSTAAHVLLRLKDPEGLDRLVKVAQKGQKTASAVAPQLPLLTQTPVLAAAAVLQQIEIDAAAAQGPVASPTPTPTPCPTPSPSPSPTPSPTPTDKPSPSPTPSATASPSPSPTPSPTPCPTPTPTPTPSPTPTPGPTQEPADSSPQPSADAQPSAEPEPTPRQSSPEAAQSSGAAEPSFTGGTSCYRVLALQVC